MSGTTIQSTPDLLSKEDETRKLPTKYVKLNVGGALFYTTLGTLTKRADSMLRAMFSGRMDVLTDSDGWVLIDRCGKHFGTILNYLRDGTIHMPDGKTELKELLTECKFYCLEVSGYWVDISYFSEGWCCFNKETFDQVVKIISRPWIC